METLLPAAFADVFRGLLRLQWHHVRFRSSSKSELFKLPLLNFGQLISSFKTQVFAYDLARGTEGEWQTLQNAAPLPSSSFSQALSVKDCGIYLTSVYSNVLHFFNPDVSPCRFETVGEFQNNILNSCYVEPSNSIVTFSTEEVHTGGENDDGPSPKHQVEVFYLKTRTFSVVWQESSNQSFVVDFGIRHSLGCFSLLRYE